MGCGRMGWWWGGSLAEFTALPLGGRWVWAFSQPGAASGMALKGWLSGYCDAMGGARRASMGTRVCVCVCVRERERFSFFSPHAPSPRGALSGLA